MTTTNVASLSSLNQVSFAVPGLEIIDHSFTVPLHHAKLEYNKTNEKIQIFVREIVSSGNKDKEKRETLKTALYLQGGPGFECARVQEIGGWIGHLAKEKNMRVFLLDQRGTGRSSPMTRQKLLREESSIDETLQYYRADSIVEDCEFVRKEMLGGEEIRRRSRAIFRRILFDDVFEQVRERGDRYGVVDWRVPPLCNKDPKDSYVKLLDRVKTQTKKYYSRFPRDKEIMKELAKLCDAKERVKTLNGNIVSARGVQGLRIFVRYRRWVREATLYVRERDLRGEWKKKSVG